jgi:hypothetical protein
MPGPWWTDAETEAALADVLNLAGGQAELEAFWVTIVPRAHTAAYNEIVGALARRGFTMAQMDTWDRRQEFEHHLSMWWCLVEGEALLEAAQPDRPPRDVPRLLYKFDRRAELLTVPITANGVLIDPAETGPGRIAVGPMDTSKDMFQLDPAVPNPWEPGYRYRR